MKLTFKKAILYIHLWLGLASGLIVCFLGITGCILAFETEIRNLTEPYQFVKKEYKPLLPPSQLMAAVNEKMPNNFKVLSMGYGPDGSASSGYYYDSLNYYVASVNPYTAEVLKVKDMNRDFFRIVVDGHFYLWLPPEIGQPIVASATLIFVILMISGLILWWPKNKAARKQRFSVKWNAKWRRVNYDLHNVFGFYMTWIAIFIALTGLVWGFQWFANSVYWVSSGGEILPEHEHPVSDTTAVAGKENIADLLWTNYMKSKKPDESLDIYLPATNTDALEVAINHRPGTYYNSDYYHFDQYTGKELEATGVYAGKFADASIAAKIARMNYDLHVGAVLGLPGKILAFCASLIAASLPVTGFYIWWGKRKKPKKPVAAGSRYAAVPA